MASSGVSGVGKAVRLPYAVVIVLLLVAVYWVAIHPWMTNWGSTAAEQQMALPGDELIPMGAGKSTKAITINAAPEVVWQWLVQIGQDRAGFYTYTWLENLFGADFRNANEIHPEWQHLAAGDGWRLLPVDYPLGLGRDSVDPLLLREPGRALVFDMFGAYIILPVDEHTSRLVVRGEASPPNLLLRMVVDPVVFTMERRMLLGLKARAEGRPDAPPMLMAIAHLGWVIAGIIVATLFLSESRRRYWLVLPVLAALPALLMSGDAQAALAAFLAAGITVLGFLVIGRSWWGPMLVIGSIVLLTLLLAPEAYIAIGFAFALIIITALGVIVHERSNALNGATHWQIHLNPDVESEITAHSDGGNMELDLSGLAVSRLSADTGGGNLDVTLPDKAVDLNVIAKTGAGSVNVDIGSSTRGSSFVDASSGAGSVVVLIPEGLAAHIHATSGLGKVIMDPRFSMMDGSTYQSPDYETAADKVEITMKCGAGNVSVDVRS